MNNQFYNPYLMNQAPIVQQFQSPQVQGKMVSNFNEITANDVPMNGNYATFVKSDMSEIQLRRWNANGTIDTASYKPFKEPLVPQMVNVSAEENKLDLEPIYARLEGIENALARIEQSSRPTSMPKATKKVVNADE